MLYVLCTAAYFPCLANCGHSPLHPSFYLLSWIATFFSTILFSLPFNFLSFLLLFLMFPTHTHTHSCFPQLACLCFVQRPFWKIRWFQAISSGHLTNGLSSYFYLLWGLLWNYFDVRCECGEYERKMEAVHPCIIRYYEKAYK